MTSKVSNGEKSLSEAMQPVQRTSLSDEIVEQIIDLISRGILRPGDRLPSEKELCLRFHVGRTTIREALRSLAVMGILDGRAGEGTFVSPDNRKYLQKTLQWGLLLDPKHVQDLIETRLMLESQTAYSAAQRATQEDLLEMKYAVKGMRQSLDKPRDFLEHDLRFHLTIARATQNPILYNLLSMTRGYLHTWIKDSLTKPSLRRGRIRALSSVREHERILQAIQAHESEHARSAMIEHILSSSKDLHPRAYQRG